MPKAMQKTIFLLLAIATVTVVAQTTRRTATTKKSTRDCSKCDGLFHRALCCEQQKRCCSQTARPVVSRPVPKHPSGQEKVQFSCNKRLCSASNHCASGEKCNSTSFKICQPKPSQIFPAPIFNNFRLTTKKPAATTHHIGTTHSGTTHSGTTKTDEEIAILENELKDEQAEVDKEKQEEKDEEQQINKDKEEEKKIEGEKEPTDQDVQEVKDEIEKLETEETKVEDDEKKVQGDAEEVQKEADKVEGDEEENPNDPKIKDEEKELQTVEEELATEVTELENEEKELTTEAQIVEDEAKDLENKENVDERRRRGLFDRRGWLAGYRGSGGYKHKYVSRSQYVSVQGVACSKDSDCGNEWVCKEEVLGCCE